MIVLKSTEQWLVHEEKPEELKRALRDKHKRIVQDLQALSLSLNATTNNNNNLLPVLHPNDPTSGIFPLTGPIGIQIVIGGKAIVTIDATGMRMGP